MTAGSFASLPPTGPTVPHHTYVGGSDIGAVAGVSPYSTPLDVWARKTGALPDDAGNDATEMGDHMERPLLALYAKRLNLMPSYPGTLLDPAETSLGATPDAIVGNLTPVQCKLVGYQQRYRWKHPDEGADGIPPEVYLQVHWEARALRSHVQVSPEHAHVVAGIGTELPVYVVPIDWELVDNLTEVARRFWSEHVVPKRMPEITTDDYATVRSILLAAYPRNTTDQLAVADDEIVKLCVAYKEASALADKHTKQKDAIANVLMERIGNGAGFASPSAGVKVQWKTEKQGPLWRKIAESFSPSKDVIEQNIPEPKRRLRVYVKG